MIPVNPSTLGRYAAHVSLVHTMKSHRAPALSVMMIFSDLLIRSTEDAYRQQGWTITPQNSGLVLRTYVAHHHDGEKLEINPKDYIARYNRLLPLYRLDRQPALQPRLAGETANKKIPCGGYRGFDANKRHAQYP